MGPSSLDVRIREAALAWCEALRSRWGDHVPARELERFPCEDGWIRLKGPQGIFKPKELSDGPLSLRSALSSPYHDAVAGRGESIRYDFSPREFENDGVKQLAESVAPLVYLVQVRPKPRPEYMVVSPVFVTGWNDAARVFEVEYQPAAGALGGRVHEASVAEKRYGLQVLRARLHQAHFRKQVLAAYRQRCAVCELRVRPLLEGAHIIADSLPGGDPTVSNGLSLCALHHRAFDRRILTIGGDYLVRVEGRAVQRTDRAAREQLLAHNGRRIYLPPEEDLRPDAWRLERHGLGA